MASLKAMGLAQLGRWLLVLGAVLAGLGALFLAVSRLSWLKLGRLPGDLFFERGGLKIYIPITTSLLISIILTLILWLVLRRW